MSEKTKVKKTEPVGFVKWLKEPEAHDYPAALSYLKLVIDEVTALSLIKKLKDGKIGHFKAKDIFRSSQLSLLGVSNSHVKKNLKKIKKGEALSPLLLVVDVKTRKIIIADGYHRLCSAYVLNEDEIIPCKIVYML